MDGNGEGLPDLGMRAVCVQRDLQAVLEACHVRVRFSFTGGVPLCRCPSWVSSGIAFQPNVIVERKDPPQAYQASVLFGIECVADAADRTDNVCSAVCAQ